MAIGHRAGRPAVLAAALLLSLAGMAQAGDEPGGEITFRLVLRGEVIEGDAFSLAVNELGVEHPTIISPGVRCGPGSETYNPVFVQCEPGTYEHVIRSTTLLPIGTQLEYVWGRIPGAPSVGDGYVIYTDTITVTEHDQVFTVTYTYGGTSVSAGGALPDTATPAAVDAVLARTGVGPLPAEIAVLTGSAVIGLLLARGVVRRSAPRADP